MAEQSGAMDDSRVTVENRGEFEELHIDGVEGGSVSVDFFHEDQPRIIVHEDGHEEPTHVVELPTESEDL